jgi:Fic family protein
VGRNNGYSPLGASHVAPQAELIERSMQDLFAFITPDDMPVIAQCAIACAQFETIHPFADGNGRCGRALVYVILRNKGMAQQTTPPISTGL